MTKEEAIADLEARKKMLQSTCMNCWDEAIEMALQALKRDDPEVEFRKRFEKSTFCGYSAQDLLMFADACRRKNISKEDLHEFCLNANSAFEYVMEKISEQMEKEMMS